MLPEFRNEPLTDFSDPANVRKMEEALARVRDQLGEVYPLIIGDKLVQAAQTFASINPAHPEQVVGHFQQGSVDDAQRALQAAETAFAEWSRAPRWSARPRPSASASSSSRPGWFTRSARAGWRRTPTSPS